MPMVVALIKNLPAAVECRTRTRRAPGRTYGSPGRFRRPPLGRPCSSAAEAVKHSGTPANTSDPANISVARRIVVVDP